MHAQIKKRRLHEVTLYRCLDRDSYGDKTFDEGTEMQCYKADEQKEIRTLEGELSLSHTQLYLDGVLKLSGQEEVLVEERRHPVQGFRRFDGLKSGAGTTVIYL